MMQALQATAAAEAERKANSSKARIELEEQMKERQILQMQQQVSTTAYCCHAVHAHQSVLSHVGSSSHCYAVHAHCESCHMLLKYHAPCLLQHASIWQQVIRSLLCVPCLLQNHIRTDSVIYRPCSVVPKNCKAHDHCKHL